MRQATLVGLLGTLAVGLTVGCGMQPVDNRMQARAESGKDQFPVEIVEGEFVCPHVVSINNQAFDVKAVISGEVEDAFGPFVPCLTSVPPGEGTCPNCKQPYRTSGDLGEGQDGPPLALPKLRCPHERNHSEEQLVDPTAVLVKGSKDSLLGYSNCPTCKRYFTVKETDLVMTIDVAEEIHCPSCMEPIDPMLNSCRNRSCKLGGVVRNVDDFEGACWRCAGMGMCPNCKGSGRGNLGMYGSSPAECWICGDSGRCPECGGSGFSVYEGALPKAYSAWGKDQAIPSPQRKWKFPHDEGTGGGGGSSSSGGGDDSDVGDVGDPEQDG